MSKFDYNEYKIESLQKELKNIKAIALISGTVGALGAIIAASNLLVGNELVALQNTGTTIAMLGQSIGYSSRIKLKSDELKRRKEKINIPYDQKEKLIELKENINNTKNFLAISTTAGIGFSVTTLANIGLMSTGNFGTTGGLLLSGTVSILEFSLALKISKKLKQDQIKAVALEKEIFEYTAEQIESKEDERRLLKVN